ncbi:hypothetical protein EDB81DRAFT_880016 [Dactylonectria macrodidyma]|uniref:Nephrocystin 3-like N-terminal domain-containing protein n=1 Tax=Dactylonectria macrodidyma TaxID=307937 RepID=A0A9P9FHS4_9HYPO|nr:hypothetical protein EDB81DRAFT_880016 [Dactylonectria macrodidyma]
MAEVFGVAAAAAQFAGLSITIIKTAKAIHDKLKDSDIQERLHEIEDLQKLIAEVKRYPELQNPETASILENCVKNSDKLCRTLEGVRISADDPLAQRTWKAIVGSMKDDEINALFDRLETAKTTLGAKIGLETFNQQRSTVTEIKRLRLSGLAPASDEDTCLRSLFQTDPARDRDGILSAKGDMTTGTCTWITSTEEYKQWNLTPPHLLWISAPPGMGKTYLSIYLSTHFEELARESIDVAAIFFFCDEKAQSRNTAFDLLRGLVYQLIQRQNDLIKILLACWKVQPDSIFEGHSLETLWKVFQDMIRAIRATTVYCVLDALDECELPSLSGLLRKFVQLATSDVQAPKIKLIALSRRAPAQLAESFSSFVELQIDQKQAMKDDVERFISVEVLRLARKKKIVDRPLHRHIEETLRQKSENTFLWLSFMVRELESQSLASIESSLENLPLGLDAVYGRILSEIEPEKMDYIAEILNWLIATPHSVPIAKLCEAVGTKPTSNLSCEEVCLDHIKCCGHLLQTSLYQATNPDREKSKNEEIFDIENCIQRDEPLWLSEEDDTHAEPARSSDELIGSDDSRTLPYYWRLHVTFLHQSAKDYLLKPSSEFEPRLIPAKKMHEDIADQLIRHLCRKDSYWKTGKYVAEEFRFDIWALGTWPIHFAQIEDISGLVKQHKDFFRKRSDTRRYLGHHHVLFSKTQNYTPPPILFMATELDLYNLATWYLHRTRTVQLLGLQKSTEERWGKFNDTSLQLACRIGNVRFVKLLVDAGAGLDPEKGDNGPLEIAALTGRMDVFQILSATKQGEKLLNPQKVRKTKHAFLLDHAAQGGNAEICRMLIESYHWDVEGLVAGMTPLSSAVFHGNASLARIFVSSWQAKNDDHAQLLKDTTAIKEANAFRSTLTLLVREWGFDPNTAIDDLGCNILCSCFIGSARIIYTQLSTFIEFGANPGQRNREGESVLHCASHHFEFPYLVVKTQLLEFLLQDGRLQINDEDNKQRTILTNLVSRMLYFVGQGARRAKCRKYLKYGPPALRRLLDLGADRFGGRDSKTVLTLAMKLSINEGRLILDETDFSMYEAVIGKARDVLDNYSTVPVELRRVYSETEEGLAV